MTRLIAVALIGAALASFAMAALPADAPEIDMNTGLGALTLLSGAVMVIRARIRK